jgi:hypothetical protein
MSIRRLIFSFKREPCKYALFNESSAQLFYISKQFIFFAFVIPFFAGATCVGMLERNWSGIYEVHRRISEHDEAELADRKIRHEDMTDTGIMDFVDNAHERDLYLLSLNLLNRGDGQHLYRLAPVEPRLTPLDGQSFQVDFKPGGSFHLGSHLETAALTAVRDEAFLTFENIRANGLSPNLAAWSDDFNPDVDHTRKNKTFKLTLSDADGLNPTFRLRNIAKANVEDGPFDLKQISQSPKRILSFSDEDGGHAPVPVTNAKILNFISTIPFHKVNGWMIDYVLGIRDESTLSRVNDISLVFTEPLSLEQIRDLVGVEPSHKYGDNPNEFESGVFSLPLEKALALTKSDKVKVIGWGGIASYYASYRTKLKR